MRASLMTQTKYKEAQQMCQQIISVHLTRIIFGNISDITPLIHSGISFKKLQTYHIIFIINSVKCMDRQPEPESSGERSMVQEKPSTVQQSSIDVVIEWNNWSILSFHRTHKMVASRWTHRQRTMTFCVKSVNLAGIKYISWFSCGICVCLRLIYNDELHFWRWRCRA